MVSERRTELKPRRPPGLKPEPAPSRDEWLVEHTPEDAEWAFSFYGVEGHEWERFDLPEEDEETTRVDRGRNS